MSLEDGMSVGRPMAFREAELYEPNLDVAPTINPRPDTQYIFAAPHTQYSATNLLTGFSELIAYNC